MGDVIPLNPHRGDTPDLNLQAVDAALDAYHGHGAYDWRDDFDADDIESMRADMLLAIGIASGILQGGDDCA